VLESDHYRDAVRYGMWGNGSGLEKAIHETHATIIGFHHYPREWLAENHDLACRLANLCGYWYFPKFAMMPDTLRKNKDHNYIRLTWENHGVAPAYHKFILNLKLVSKSSGKFYSQQLTESDNRTWLPGEIVAEQYSLNPDPAMERGKYDVLINMHHSDGFHDSNIGLALKKEREVEEGWYKLGEIMLK
jgi:hypothetical protein